MYDASGDKKINKKSIVTMSTFQISIFLKPNKQYH